MADCVFCTIAKPDQGALHLYQDDDVVGIADLAPVAPVHILLIPRVHIVNLDALTSDRPWNAIRTGAQTLSRQHGWDSTGYRLVINTGTDGGQTVAHLHVHLLAGRSLQWPPG